MKFKVGDKVEVRPDLRFTQDYYSVCNEMLLMKGQVYTIERIDSNDDSIRLLEDDNGFMWHESWLQHLYKSPALQMFLYQEE